jgi:Predicted dehydrogenases and related proteins
MTPIRVAVIGAGGIATRHIANLAWFPGVRLVGVADPVIEAAETQARRVAGAQAFADWREMLDSVAAEALLICVPPYAHGEPELGAVERGLPFFVEKPVAADLATAERIAEAVATRGLVTAVGYHWRYLDTTERAAELLADNPAHLAMGYWWDATPPRAWWVRQATSGGQIVEQTTHIFDLARHLVGEADVVSTIVRHAPDRQHAFPDADVADASLASVVFDSGAIGTFASTHLLRWPHRIGLHLVSDGMVLELSESELIIDVGQGRPVTRPGRDPFVAELRDFLAAVSGAENRIRAPFAEALRTQRLTVAATEAATARRRPGSECESLSVEG